MGAVIEGTPVMSTFRLYLPLVTPGVSSNYYAIDPAIKVQYQKGSFGFSIQPANFGEYEAAHGYISAVDWDRPEGGVFINTSQSPDYSVPVVIEQVGDIKYVRASMQTPGGSVVITII